MVAIRRILGEPEVVWRSAHPIWREYAGQPNSAGRVDLHVPLLLRFDKDTFIEDFMAMLQNAPARIREWQVGKETWRLPLPPVTVQGAVVSPINWQPPAVPDELENESLKFYQPAHERYYLVTASLICRIPGLPDKLLDFSAEERVTFVLRRKMRLTPNGVPVEHAFISGMWQAVDSNDTRSLQRNLDDIAEEQYPMFPSHYHDRPTSTQRRIFAGLIPVSQREKFLTAGRKSADAVGGASANPVVSRTDTLMTLFDVDVVSPWLNLVRQVKVTPSQNGAAFRAIDASFEEMDADGLINLRSNTVIVRNQFQSASWYTLLDFAYFLNTYLITVWNVIANNANANSLSGANKTLYDLLANTRFLSAPAIATAITKDHFYDQLQGLPPTNNDTSMVAALYSVWQAKDALEAVTGLPNTNYLLTGVNVRGLVHRPAPGNPGSSQIEEAVRDALEATLPAANERLPQIPTAKGISDNTGSSDYVDDEFVIRCVYERPNCPPGVRPEIVSLETQPFTMAAYMDPDAPARPFRIPMPIDTTPAGIRKFAKNTMFVLSDTLACQVEAARNITFGDLVLSVLPWPFHKDLPSVGAGECKPGLTIGKLCTLSIPIITICALILLIIIVLLLDIIFKWIPYLIFCLPLPGLKAKD
jgi:hypothetical protein